MLELHVYYRFRNKEDRDGFYGEIVKNNVRALCEAEKGCIMYRYFLPLDNDKEIFLLEMWENTEVHKVHKEQPHFLMLGDIKAKYNTESTIERWDSKEHI